MKKRISRRSFLHSSALAGVGGLLSACVPAAAPQTSQGDAASGAVSSEVAEIRFAEGSWVGPEGISYWTDTIIAQFEAENEGIKVVFENAESSQYSEKLYAQAVAGDAPDVMFLWFNMPIDLMLMGQLLPIEDYFDEEYLADFYSAKLVPHQYEGHLYALPKYLNGIALAYNKDILDEAGVDYPDATWDWNDLLAACQATTKKDDNGNIVQWGTSAVYQAHAPMWVWANGGRWMDVDFLGTQCTLDEPEAMQALQFFHEMIWGADPVAPKAGDIPDSGWSNVFSTGKVAFIESQSWTVSNLVRENNFNWDFIDLPMSPTGGRAVRVATNCYAIYAGTAAPEASVQLVEFLTSPWAVEQGVTSIVGMEPARRSMAEVWDTRSLGAQEGYDVAAFSRGLEHARLHPFFVDNAKINELFSPIWDQIWVTGEMGLEEGIALIVERIDEYFASA